MSAFDLVATMDGIAQRIPADSTGRVFAYPPDAVTVPCAVVGYPTTIDFDLTYGRGGDTVTIPVWYLVGKASDRVARDALGRVLGGVADIKDALDGDFLDGSLRVTTCSVEAVTVAGVEYLAARFDCEVI